MFRFITFAALVFDTPNEEWVLHDPLIGEWRGQAYEVPEGFRTDLASIPQAFQNLIPQTGKHVYAAIMHDAGYEDVFPGLTRAEVDAMFLDAMVALRVPWWQRNVMYAAVRAFGGSLWGKAETPAAA
jgi:hypothetical protein